MSHSRVVWFVCRHVLARSESCPGRGQMGCVYTVSVDRRTNSVFHTCFHVCFFSRACSSLVVFPWSSFALSKNACLRPLFVSLLSGTYRRLWPNSYSSATARHSASEAMDWVLPQTLIRIPAQDRETADASGAEVGHSVFAVVLPFWHMLCAIRWQSCSALAATPDMFRSFLSVASFFFLESQCIGAAFQRACYASPVIPVCFVSLQLIGCHCSW